MFAVLHILACGLTPSKACVGARDTGTVVLGGYNASTTPGALPVTPGARCDGGGGGFYPGPTSP